MKRIALLTTATLIVATAVVALATDKPPWASAARSGNTTVRIKGGEFWFKLSAKSAPRGTVTFVFKNVAALRYRSTQARSDLRKSRARRARK